MPPPRFPTVILLTLLTSAALLHTSSAAAGDDVNSLVFENPRLRQAYIALQAWKSAIFSDPFNFTTNWTGPNVCSYGGVYCAPSPANPSVRVVAGVDLNHADIAGYLPPELGLLTDLALFHINSNRFCGTVPKSFENLTLLHELDLSKTDSLGGVPNKLFDKDLDAVFLNDNRFRFGIPENLGNSPVSVLVLANNDLGGCIPASIGKMGKTLNEIILMNDNLTGCLPVQIGLLKEVTVFDVSFNGLQGPLPAAIGGMRSVEQLDVAHNRLTGVVPASICRLPSAACSAAAGKVFDDSENCIVERRTSGRLGSVLREMPALLIVGSFNAVVLRLLRRPSAPTPTSPSVPTTPSAPTPTSPSVPTTPRPSQPPTTVPTPKPTSPPPPTSGSSPSGKSHPPPPPATSHPPSTSPITPPPTSQISPPTGQPVPSPPHGSQGSPPTGSHGSPPQGSHGSPPTGSHGSPPTGGHGSRQPVATVHLQQVATVHRQPVATVHLQQVATVHRQPVATDHRQPVPRSPQR
ncbi:hypothetical protein OSB04_014683 [Centaurea solstitialis]|uniref:Cell wall hydroxyproline-rich glycoprotein n=1 Tax=Centaurea solstitialis TaxID=347529 RepID=A0AA38T5C1_9ASTR|nr:hypothetical protein OSB04_014683 [Centaurea solstitialis]